MTALRRLLHAVIGDLRWAPPPWVLFIARPLIAANRVRRREPRRFWSALVGLLVIAGGGYGAYRYIASRPQPAYITATVCEPAPTGLDADAKPNPLRIVFSGAAAPLERIGKVVSSDFTVSPPIAGNWEWLSDTELRFSPAAEWPVGQPYVLEIKPGFLAPQARMQRPRVEFRSPPITATVAASEFWEDPTDAQNKRVAVTLQFTHPVDKAALEKRLALRMRVDPVTSFDNQQARSLGFKVSYDDTGARAFVQSEAIRIPDRPGAVQLRLDAGVPAARGGAGTDVPVLTEVAVPGVATYFQVGEINAAVVTNQAHRMEHVATVDFTAPVKAETLAKYVSVWELPLDRPAIGDAPAEKNFSWSEPEQVVPEVLAVARKLDVTWLPTETDWSKQQSFRFEAAEGRPLFVQIEKGAIAFGDYALVEPYRAVVPVEAFPRTVEIMHDGAVLALSGQRKLSVLARNLDAIEIKLSRLLPSTVAHFASQTGGSFQQPYFRSNSFGLDDLAEVVREVRPLAPVAPGEAQYEVVDFGAFLANGAPPRGLFQLQVSAWDPERKLVIDDIEAAARVVLVTDLGFLVKDALDGSHDVFVVSVASGQPVADAEVQILGRNGLPVLTRTTDAAGRASFPPTADFTREKQPVAYVVQKAGDLSFLPFDRRDRRLDFSRFDTGGLSDDAELESLQGYLFSDRGVYRPGEEVTLGLIVKKLDWTPLPDDLPLLLEVIDARDRTIQSESVRMPREGFRDFRFKTFDSSPTGTYQVRLSIARDGESHALLGETTVKVEEFLPDRMTITTTLSPSRAVGWVAPKELVARVSLRNLIGTPATGNRIKASLRLAPALPSFARWPAWHFYDPLTAKQSYDETLAELSTGDDGTAELPLHLERFDSATYRLRVIAEGFETEGNRSVASDATALVSPLPYLVGWKADGDLNWIKRDTACAVNIVAVGPDLEPIATDDVSAELFEITYVRVLAKQENGLLGYQSVRKDISQGTQPLPLGAAPLKLILPTAQAGSFVYVLRDKAGTELNRIGFEVVGDGNVAGRVERNAELKVRLDKADYAPGDEIEMSIVAPYAGAGLITIERDRVYASAWFKSDGNATVQRIRLPEAVEGNAYIVVSFVRDLASRDIFVSPLSSGAVPFSISRTRRTQTLTLDVPERVPPGTPLHIAWTTGAPTKLAVFAVDEGILQVARWKEPDPLAYLFRKRALAVTTAQILDLLLPELDIVRALAAPGGDEDALLAGNLNPFKRKGQPPVAYWSGIMDVPAGAGALDYVVPDYFNGTLRVTAVAVNDRAIGVTGAKVISRGPFVINPTLPLFAAPGDEFDTTAIVTNTLEGSGAGVPVQVTLEPSAGLELVGDAAQTLTIDEGRDVAAHWRLRVTGSPGVAGAVFRAASGTHATTATQDMSVRPAAPALTTVATAIAARGGTAELPVDRVLYSELRDVEASAATSPLGLVPGLSRYLTTYPHLCTEQLVSAALPGLVLGTHAEELGIDPARAEALFERARLTLQARQNSDGDFGIWSADANTDPFITAYATHYLIEARARGRAVPDGMLRRALSALAQNLEPSDDLFELRTKSYGLYLLTRSGQVKLAEARALRDVLVALPAEQWNGSVAALFLAAVFKQLNLEDDAKPLLAGVALGRRGETDYDDFDDPLSRDGLTLYLLSKHFPDRARALPPDALLALGDEVAKFNTFSAGTVILGLDAYAQAVPPTVAQNLRISAIGADGTAQPLTTTGSVVLSAAVPEGAKSIRFEASGGTPLFHQLVQAGFDRTPQTVKVANGLEVARELRLAGGKAAVAKAGIHDKLDVVVSVRATDGVEREVAVVDLLPGGFEVDLSSDALLQRRSLVGGDDVWEPQYVDAREDRVAFYGTVGDRARRFVYRIKPTNRGHFQVPPVQIEGMYDRGAWGRGAGSAIDVTD